MVTQKPISLKIDTELLQELDEEARLGWRKRNCIINQAIALYLSLQDCRRRVKCIGDPDAKVDEVYYWLERYFPEAVPEYPME